MASLALLTPPVDWALSLDEVKAQLRIDFDDDDVYLASLIAAATTHCEAVTGRQLLPATYQLRLDHWPGSMYRIDRYPWSHHVIEIPRPPMIALTSIQYYDMGGNLTLWDPSNYVVDQPSGYLAGRTRISLAFTKYWPVILPQADSVLVEFTAGYPYTGTRTPPSGVPPALKLGMQIAITDWYEVRNEGTADPMRARRLWLPYVSRSETRQLD